MSLELTKKQRETIRIAMKESPETLAKFLWEAQEKMLSAEYIAMVDRMLLDGFSPEWILKNQGNAGIPEELHEPTILALYYRLAQLKVRQAIIQNIAGSN